MLQRSDLGDLAAAYTVLRPQGGELQGRCPFHDERSPSFWVNTAKGVYHCFGCGASGDTITFVQEKMGLDFMESVEYLADRYRVQLEFEEGTGSGKPRVNKRRLYELTDAAATFYETHLWKSAGAAHAREYLEHRHISTDTARAFRMGYSPGSERALAQGADSKGFTKEEQQEARLLTSNGRDFFRGRLMVPIIDRADRVIGFGARKLRDDQFGGKYVNSADGVLFHKKQTVFLSPGIRAAAQASGRVVVVEGYMDVIALWQSGFRDVCAVMGTALTEQQVLELKRMASLALFAFDPDTAGQAATLRALEQAQKAELEVRVVLLPGGDPADVVTSADGRDQMEELLAASVSLLHYRVSALLGSGDIGDESERERMWRAGLEMFAAVADSPERKRQIDRFAFGLGLDSESVHMLQRATGSDRRLADMSRHSPARTGAAGASVHAAPVSPAIMLERRFLAAAMIARERGGVDLAATCDVQSHHLSVELHQRAWELLRSTTDMPLDVSRIHSDTELVGLTAELTALGQRERLDAAGDHAVAVLHELTSRLERRWLDREIAALKERIALADDVLELLEEKARLETQRQAVIARLRDSPHKE